MEQFEEEVKICLCLRHVSPSPHLDVLDLELAGFGGICFKFIVAEVVGDFARYLSRQIGRVKISRP